MVRTIAWTRAFAQKKIIINLLKKIRKEVSI
jgi:hypothetical protein